MKTNENLKNIWFKKINVPKIAWNAYDFNYKIKDIN